MNYAKSSASFKIRSRRSRVRKRGALTIAIFGGAAIWLLAHGHSRPVVVNAMPAQRPPFLAMPVETRAAPAPWSAGDRARLSNGLRSAFAPAVAGAKAWSFAVVGGDGQTIYDDRATHAVAPASAQKLVVAAGALDVLGPAYRYHTMFAAREGIEEGGRLDGDLWLIGSGDPSLVSGDLRNGIAVLARSGLRRVGGRVMVDASALSGPELNPHWERDDNGQDYAAPVSAISLDGNTIESQQVVGGVEESVWTPMKNVAAYVGARTNALLIARGIVPALPPAAGPSPLESVVLWDHRSPPLQALETHMLFVSDNHYAEQLLRTVGEESRGEGNDAAGLEAERSFLDRHGIPTPGLRLFDGSGLSPDNRVAAITLARLLYDAQPSLYLLLPQGGRQGTLEDYDFTTALGRVRAKSGHLSNVSSLAGYVNTMHHGRVTFAFLIDGSRGDPDAAIVRAVDRLAAL